MAMRSLLPNNLRKPPTRPSWHYQQIRKNEDYGADDEVLKYTDGEEQHERGPVHLTTTSTTARTIRATTMICTATILFAAFGFTIMFFVLRTHFQRSTTGHCQEPVARHEWRSLSRGEKNEYIEAVRCLARQPSKMRDNGTLYDDFPWIHRHFGALSHNAASFLPWHRFLIHLYERALQDDCGYKGHLTYWDWSLDWEDLAHSPIWDTSHGFGGDGDPKGITTVGKGRCVIDGPLKDLRPIFFNNEDNEHCLSRGFWDGEQAGKLSGAALSPAAVEEILEQPDYASFFLKLEKGPHNAIPNGVRGDFLKFTAPSDPVFFLHHVQLDRVWWLWQQRHPGAAYIGNATHNSLKQASLNDLLPMGGALAPDTRVEDLMSSTKGILCYRY